MLSKAAIYDLLSDLHASMTTYLSGAGFTIPEQSYVHIGQVADDTEQLVVAANRIYFGTIDDNTIRDAKLVVLPRVLVAEVRFLMCAVTQDGEDPPSPEDLEANAEECLTWGIGIGNALINAHKVDRVFNECAGLGIGENTPIGPEGGYVGWSQALFIGF